MLYPTTCVGLRYGFRMGLSLAGFLGSMVTCAVARPRGDRHTLVLRLGGRTSLPPSAPLHFNGEIRISAAVSLLRHRVAPMGSHGILTVRPSASAIALALGPDSPRDERHCPGNLSLAAGGVLALLVVTYTYICVSMRSRISRNHHSQHMECSPTDTFFNAIPRLRCPAYTRLLSTRGPSTSELLRTL